MPFAFCLSFLTINNSKFIIHNSQFIFHPIIHLLLPPEERPDEELPELRDELLDLELLPELLEEPELREPEYELPELRDELLDDLDELLETLELLFAPLE